MSKRRKSTGTVCFVLGTRPEIIKLSPLIRYFGKNRADYRLLHTGQHYSYEMDRIFFKTLGLPKPHYQLNMRSKGLSGHAEHTGLMMAAIEKIFIKIRPRVCVVQGDTNTVLAAALVAAKMKDVALAHVEAGLRSFDEAMPEEINRIMTDHVSDLLFAPTKEACVLLKKESIPAHKIFMTGNTIVDAVQENLELAKKETVYSALIKNLPSKFILMTLHRPENVDSGERLRFLIAGAEESAQKLGMPVFFSVHPRTYAQIRKFKIQLSGRMKLLKPVGFLEFLMLEKKASLILTDSGGVQEEACILRVPCVTLRTSTERPETVSVGANVIAGFNKKEIVSQALRMAKISRNWKNPFGDGKSASKITLILKKKYSL